MMEIKLQKYDVYKNSGVEWLGKIPEGWEVKRFKHIFHEKKKTTNVDLNCGSISFGKVVYKDDEKIPEATKRSYQVLLKGDFLTNPLNLNYDLISLRICLSYIDIVVSSGYIIVKNSVEIDKEYYKWLLHIFDIAYMKTLGSGVRQTLSSTHVANSELIYPSLKEQASIAKFLDDKTAKIDQAMGIKQNQIALLKEHGYQGIRVGEFVIHNMDAFAGAIGVSDSHVKSTPVYSACTPIKQSVTNVHFYKYFMREIARRGFIESLAKGIRERSTDFRFKDFAGLQLPIPLIRDQNSSIY